MSQIISVNPENIHCALLIENIAQDVGIDVIMNECEMFGDVSSIMLNPNQRCATVTYMNKQCSEKAEEHLHESKAFNNSDVKIQLANNSLKEFKESNWNLLLKNLPEQIDIVLMLKYLSQEFGKVSSLVFTKENNTYIGEEVAKQQIKYGLLRFNSQESYDKIMNVQRTSGCIAIPDSPLAFSVCPLVKDGEKNTIKTSKVFVDWQLGDEGFKDGFLQKFSTLKEVIVGLAEKFNKKDNQFGCTHFEYYFDLDVEQKILSATIEFVPEESSSYETLEENAFIYIKQAVRTSDMGNNPIVSFDLIEGNERTILFEKIKENLTPKSIAQWLSIHAKLETQPQFIKVFSERENWYALLQFDRMEKGNNLMMSLAKVDKSLIFNTIHRVTINLSKQYHRAIRGSEYWSLFY